MLDWKVSTLMPSPLPRYRYHCTEGRIVNRFVLAAALAIGLSSIAQAEVIELVPEPGAQPVHSRAVDHAFSRHTSALPTVMSELPEPEVFAMMLVGLILLGYRARRDSNEKFK